MTETATKPRPTSTTDIFEATKAILAQVVHEVAGPDAKPRPGQAMLAADIARTLYNYGDHLAGQAPTGTGKSYAYLAAVMADAAINGTRAVISTESLALQSQIVDKDAPMVAAATYEVTGVMPEIALHKGFGNYVCSRALAKQLEKATGQPVLATDMGFRQALETLRKSGGALPTDLNLYEWAVEAITTPGEPDPRQADRAFYTGDLPPGAWESISVSSSECKGTQSCPFAKLCLPHLSRSKASGADIVVTNHTMLGIQTAHGVPAILGSQTLGDFDHLVIDEAHGLASAVRNQGANEISEATIRRLPNLILRLVEQNHPLYEALAAEADDVADQIKHELAKHMATAGPRETVCKIPKDSDTFDPAVVYAAIGFVRRLRGNATRIAKGLGERGDDELKKITIRCSEVLGALNTIQNARTGVARWVEPSSYNAELVVARSTPVDVSSMLKHRLYSNTDLAQGSSEDPDPEASALSLEEPQNVEEPETHQYTVIAVSATLPKGFCREAGLACSTSTYASPFEVAYQHSAVFVPRAKDPSDVSQLENKWGKLDTRRHSDWAGRHIVKLVEANNGSALVLAATASSGKAYVELLRRTLNMTVYSQWDLSSTRLSVQQWKTDVNAVLVGTRSLMTGVDAPGETCSLVVIDRPARSAGNPVDDARVDMLVTEAEISEWTADRLVYVADAATLLDQAAGRLIRSVTDVGMVAVLDPRLLRKGTAFKYQKQTRELYMEPLDKFGTKFSDIDRATEWLADRHKGGDLR